MCFVAISSPIRVFPAPGTPVTKHMDLRDLAFESRIISDIVSDVWLRFTAFASLREISLTECPLYRASAASIIVGVGWYRPNSHSFWSLLTPSVKITYHLAVSHPRWVQHALR